MSLIIILAHQKLSDGTKFQMNRTHCWFWHIYSHIQICESTVLFFFFFSFKHQQQCYDELVNTFILHSLNLSFSSSLETFINIFACHLLSKHLDCCFSGYCLPPTSIFVSHLLLETADGNELIVLCTTPVQVSFMSFSHLLRSMYWVHWSFSDVSVYLSASVSYSGMLFPAHEINFGYFSLAKTSEQSCSITVFSRFPEWL